MRNLKSLVIGLAFLATSSAALAQRTCPPGQTLVQFGGQFFCVTLGSPVPVPEISTKTGGSGLLLLAGTIAVIRGRRRTVKALQTES